MGAALAAACALASCAPGCAPERERVVSILSYNAMAFFDGEDCGLEYPDYRVSGGEWGPEPYRRRLSNLKAALMACDPGGPDIACLVEIENQGVLEDLAAAMKPSGYLFSGFAGGDTATGCGILSRLPILGLRAHRPAAAEGEDPYRPVLEAELDLRGARLFVFVNHWKSKSGGEEETEGRRIESAALLARLMARREREHPGALVLACGDMNEEADEWENAGTSYPTALGKLTRGRRGYESSPPGGSPIILSGRPEPGSPGFPEDLPGGREGRMAYLAVSPWLFPENSSEWSYWWEGRGERIDHFFLCPSLFDGQLWEFGAFRAVMEESLLDGAGRPAAWDSRTGRGFSDHLPLVIELLAP